MGAQRRRRWRDDRDRDRDRVLGREKGSGEHMQWCSQIKNEKATDPDAQNEKARERERERRGGRTCTVLAMLTTPKMPKIWDELSYCVHPPRRHVGAGCRRHERGSESWWAKGKRGRGEHGIGTHVSNSRCGAEKSLRRCPAPTAKHKLGSRERTLQWLLMPCGTATRT